MFYYTIFMTTSSHSMTVVRQTSAPVSSHDSCSPNVSLYVMLSISETERELQGDTLPSLFHRLRSQ